MQRTDKVRAPWWEEEEAAGQADSEGAIEGWPGEH